MIDYIRWLLEEEEDETAGILDWKTWSFLDRQREWQEGPPREEEESPGVFRMPEDELGWQEVGFRGSLGEKKEDRSLAIPFAWEREKFLEEGWSRPSREGEKPAATQTVWKRVAGLYRQAARLRRLAGFAGEQSRRGLVQREESVRKESPLDLRHLDHAFQQDARRYDGGFPLL